MLCSQRSFFDEIIYRFRFEDEKRNTHVESKFRIPNSTFMNCLHRGLWFSLLTHTAGIEISWKNYVLDVSQRKIL